MKKICLIAGITLMGLLALGLTKASFARRNPSGRSRRVLIGFKDGTGPQAAERRRHYVRERGGRVRRSYRHLPAAAAELSESQISRLRADPRVAYIEEDGEVHTLDAELDSSWGVKHIGAGDIHTYNNKGAGINVAIIDTGINLNHGDLAVAGNVTFVDGTTTGNDDNGHGTHCAGIVAALDNDFGVIGVAPKASIYAVKVLNSGGSGYLSDVVAGIEWAIDNNIDIISMSLGTDYNYLTLRDACDNAYAAGILLVAAAGNDYSIRRGSERDTVDYPARYDSVIAVGATNDADVKASWSSTGEALELAAPGVNIYSTYLGNSYTTKSGTSMACPHVAGVAALVLVAGSNSGVRTTLQDTADDLGGSGWDNWYGYGLVDAGEAAGATGTPLELESIAVSPGTASIPKGFNQQYTAIGTYSDDSTANITTTVDWKSSDTGAATIDATGLAAGVGEGTTYITASLDSVTSDKAVLTVEAPILVSITVAPETASIEVGSIQQYSATGIYSDWSEVDITTTVDWTSSNTGVATIDATGLATGVGEGTTSITASLDIMGLITSNKAKLTVTPPPPTLMSITVTPADVSIPAGSTQQYTATGTYSNNSMADITGSVTWKSTNTLVATINASGLATAEAEGNTTITAALDGKEGDTKLTVTEAPSDVQVFSDSFESSADWTANWSQDAQNDWHRRTARPYDASYSAEVDGRAMDAQLISKDIDLQGRSNATITFWWYIESGLDTGEYLAFDVSIDGGNTWTEMETLNGNYDSENTWHYEEFELTGISSLKIQFRGTMSSSREDAYVDVVAVIAW